MKKILVVLVALAVMFVSAVAFAADAFVANTPEPASGLFNFEIGAHATSGLKNSGEVGLKFSTFMPGEDLGCWGTRVFLEGLLRNDVLGEQKDFSYVVAGIGRSCKPSARVDSATSSVYLMYGGGETWINEEREKLSGPVAEIVLTGWEVYPKQRGEELLPLKRYSIGARGFFLEEGDPWVSADARWYLWLNSLVGGMVGLNYNKDMDAMGSVAGVDLCVTLDLQLNKVCVIARNRFGADNPEDDGTSYGIAGSISW